MRKNEAIKAFMNSFGVPAYPIGAVPGEDDIEYPYMTYENSVGNTGDTPVYIAAQLFYYTSSERVINDKVEEIAAAIGRGGRMIPYIDGAVWIRRGSPWSNPITDENPAIKGRQLNITLEFV